MDPELQTLKALDSLLFPIGKKLLSDILFGRETDQISRLKLDKNTHFGTLGLYQQSEITSIIDSLIQKGLIEVRRERTSRFFPVLFITKKGKNALKSDKIPETGDISYETSRISRKEKKLASSLEHLAGYSEEQKHAIVSDAKSILCIAGAGSGKTTVLTRRIEFLSAYKGSEDSRILAITFTRKARLEMISRLNDIMPGHSVNVETFNSFCEKQVRKNSSLIYSKDYRVLGFGGKIRITAMALSELGISQDEAIKAYFSRAKRESNEKKSLFLMMINDLFAIMDHYRNNEEDIAGYEEAVRTVPGLTDKKACRLAYDLITRIISLKKKHGLRDYTDQIVHCLRLFKDHPKTIPRFEHLLIDEFQDVNRLQVKLVGLLDAGNLFAVGDPRQSIFGWRGSKIEYITRFQEHYPESKVIQLKKNYRSTEQIVRFSNKAIRSMKLPDMESNDRQGDEVKIISHNDETEEAMFIAQSILHLDVQKSEIFILGRTNKQLEVVSRMLDEFGIRYLKRTVENQRSEVVPEPDQVTLSTIHAIKGLEADVVYLIGVNTNNFPCRAKEHPAIEYAKLEDYDKYAEELRVFYVGITRAKKQLIVSYFSKRSIFLDDNTELPQFFRRKKRGSLADSLREWRSQTAKSLGVPAYFIFNDRTMLAIAAQKPENLGELSMIPGMGPMKINRYGQDIIDIIRQS